MPAVIIIGAQWGDEGKGKVVDLLAEQADVVVRYAGGPNAGHTLVVGEDRVVLRLIPSGVLHPHTHCILGQGMAINADVLLEEIDTLEQRGLSVQQRLSVSELAHLILPYHIELDGLRESAATGTKIGTTKRGLGPCYEDKAGRRGIRIADLRNEKQLRARVSEACRNWSPVFQSLGASAPNEDAICDHLLDIAKRILPLACDASAALEKERIAGKKIMLEGAQGTMLDIDHGTYPFVTSSSAVSGGACTGAGMGPSRIDRVIGITKAYTTRVGGGPFPTELDNEFGRHLQTKGHEFGSVTGRPRRAGWLDLAALRYAARVNGLDGLALTKVDVLSGLDYVDVCVGYEVDGTMHDAMPIAQLDRAKPVYERLAGWSEEIGSCRSLNELPTPVREFIDFVETRSNLPIFILSVGPRRDETIILRDAMAG